MLKKGIFNIGLLLFLFSGLLVSQEVLQEIKLSNYEEDVEKSMDEGIAKAVGNVAAELIKSGQPPQVERFKRALLKHAREYAIDPEAIEKESFFGLVKTWILKVSVDKDRIAETIMHYKKNYGYKSKFFFELHPIPRFVYGKNIDEVLDQSYRIILDMLKDEFGKDQFRLERIGKNRLYLEITSALDVQLQVITDLQQQTRLELRFVASEKAGGIEPEEEGVLYEEAKKSGPKSLELYLQRLLQKGFAWFPHDRYAKEYLLWLKDGYDIIGDSFENFAICYLNGPQAQIEFRLREAYRDSFFAMTSKYKREHLAIVFNGKVVVVPLIQEAIPQGRGVLPGLGFAEFRHLQKMLKTKRLDVRVDLLAINFDTALKEAPLNLRSGIWVHLKLKAALTCREVKQRLSSNACVEKLSTSPEVHAFILRVPDPKAGDLAALRKAGQEEEALKLAVEKLSQLFEKEGISIEHSAFFQVLWPE